MSKPKTGPRSRQAPRRPAQTMRTGRAVRAGLFVTTLAVGVGLAFIPVGTWQDQQDDLRDARLRQTELEAEIAEIEADIEGIVGEEGFELAALCFGPFVLVGVEVYAIPGLQGCVVDNP